jgi:hypothetical protein
VWICAGGECVEFVGEDEEELSFGAGVLDAGILYAGINSRIRV